MKKCIHVYELVGSLICLDCGKDTHEINWVQELEYRRVHVEKYGFGYEAPPVWWSI